MAGSVKTAFKIALLASVLAGVSTLAPRTAGAQEGATAGAIEAQALVDKAKATFDGFMAAKEMGWFRDHLKDAKAVLIYPQVLKAGFFLGGSGGTGVLLAKDEKTGAWSQPAFYTVGSVSYGLQIGGESAEVIVLVMSQPALDSLYASSVKLGGNLSATAGPVGIGAEANLPAYFVSFARSKGLYAGMSLEGSVVAVRDGLNEAYYGKAVSPLEIVVKGVVENAGATALRDALKAAAGG